MWKGIEEDIMYRRGEEWMVLYVKDTFTIFGRIANYKIHEIKSVDIIQV